MSFFGPAEDSFEVVDVYGEPVAFAVLGQVNGICSDVMFEVGGEFAGDLG